MQYFEEFRYCPRCGTTYDEQDFDRDEVLFRCHSCDFHFYQNSIPSAAVVIPLAGQEHRIMLITRGIEPAKGLKGLPGGMLGYHEPGVAAAVREVKEETGYDIRIRSLFGTYHIDYEFQGRIRSVLEIDYLAYPVSANSSTEQTSLEATAIGFFDVAQIRHREELAFPCHFDVIQSYARYIGRAESGDR